MTNIAAIRKEYQLNKLNKSEVKPNPIHQFNKWMDEAIKADLPYPTAMSLSTVSTGNRPSSRTVLLKEVLDKGFVFFSNYESKKSTHIDNNPLVALLFFWPELERQVRIEGTIERIRAKDSDAYFHSRPWGNKIGAWASPQSQEIPDREYLDKLKEKFEKRFATIKPKRPDNWGGYLVQPDLVEFWQGRPDRLHDRIEYLYEDHAWHIRRLAP